MNQKTKMMKRALFQAKKASAEDEVPIGAVVVKDGKVISATIGYEAPEFDELILLIERQLNSAN